MIQIPLKTSFQEYLYIFSKLPNYVLKFLNFTPQTLDEKKYVTELEWKYTVLAQWLTYLVGRDKPIDPDLFFNPNKIALKPDADAIVSVLDLITELLPRSPHLQVYFSTPAEILIAYQADKLKRSLWEISGLLTGVPAEVNKKMLTVSKRDLERLDQIKFIKKVDLLDTKTAAMPTTSAMLFVWSCAEWVSQNDKYFCSYIYKPFKRKMMVHNNRVARDPNFQITQFKDGKALTGKNRPRKPRTTGFVTKTLHKG